MMPSLRYKYHHCARLYFIREVTLLNTLSKALRLHLTGNVLGDDFDTVLVIERFLVRKLLSNN